MEAEERELMSYLENFFDDTCDSKLLLKYLELATKQRNSMVEREDQPRLHLERDRTETVDDLTEKYSVLPNEPQDPSVEVQSIVSDLFEGVPRWLSPKMQVNGGTAPNSATSSL